MDWMDKLFDSMKRFALAIVHAVVYALGLWIVLLVVNALIGYFKVAVAPSVFGVNVGTDYWATLGLFVALAVVVTFVRDVWNENLE